MNELFFTKLCVKNDEALYSVSPDLKITGILPMLYIYHVIVNIIEIFQFLVIRKFVGLL